MPYCEILTTTKVEKAEEMKLNHEIARIIEQIPGKSERWVMTHIQDETRMAFAGTNAAPAAVITVKTFGELAPEQYDMLTKSFCQSAAQLLKVPSDRLYVTYEPITHWGWDGANF